jgi:UDP-N-acetylmuramate--alanine ligase
MSVQAESTDQLKQRFAAGLHEDTVLRSSEALAKKTTMGVGGKALLYAEPANRDDLLLLIQRAAAEQLPWFVLGRGSNVIVPDEGYAGLILRLVNPGWKAIQVLEQRKIRVGAGTRLQQLCAEACRLGMAGFEFLEGIPGTLGGALRMNAGAMGSWMFDVVDSVEVLTATGEIHELQREALHPVYRKCPELVDCVALSAVLCCQRFEDSDSIRQRLAEFAGKRKSSQPREASAGCLFKNPADNFAGRLIDQCGLKGTQFGLAEISTIHANFLVNSGGATAGEIIQLVKNIRKDVHGKTGYLLEPEAILLGKSWEEVL